jgi:AAA+ ATPase superfamily predicted ATPase
MNPFSYGTIVKSEHFFDREEECSRIVSTLANGNNIVLFAPRRYGKTSLVFKVIEELELQDIQCIYFDFMPVFSIESFVTNYLEAIKKKQTNLQKFIQTFAGVIRNIRPKLTFDLSGNPEFGIEFLEQTISSQTLSDVLDLPEKMSENGKRLVVVFDEFQEITKFDKFNFESLLRSKIQQQNVNYLFLGSRTHLLNDMFNNKKRAFYNSASHIQLNTLPREETIGYLQRQFKTSGIVISRENAFLLIEEAGDIPYYIQFLAAEIWQYAVNYVQDVNSEIIKFCSNKIIELKQDYYYELFDRQSVLQKKLLKALVISGDNVFSTQYAQQFRLSAPSSIQKAIVVLMENGIIDKTQHSYFISDPFFKRYIQNYA